MRQEKEPLFVQTAERLAERNSQTDVSLTLAGRIEVVFHGFGEDGSPDSNNGERESEMKTLKCEPHSAISDACSHHVQGKA
jgi:hypothetical protein